MGKVTDRLPLLLFILGGVGGWLGRQRKDHSELKKAADENARLREQHARSDRQERAKAYLDVLSASRDITWATDALEGPTSFSFESVGGARGFALRARAQLTSAGSHVALTGTDEAAEALRLAHNASTADGVPAAEQRFIRAARKDVGADAQIG